MTSVPLPPALRSARISPFVGRADETARVQRVWQSVCLGRRKALLVAGDPGIGKSRLLEESAQWVHARGGLVLFGRCDEETLVPYQPFVEALRHVAAHLGTARLEELAGPDAAELGRLLPELHDGADVLDDPTEGERYRLFETVNALLCAVSAEAPVLLVLEDLQWVDTASALLLRHLFRHPAAGSLLVLASYRDVEIAPGHPFEGALAELRGGDVGERLRLGGLSTPDVARLVASQAGEAAIDATFADSLWRQTEGNPFFVEEVVRQLRDVGRTGPLTLEGLGIPEGVKDVIGRRLIRLSESTNRVLEHAAVLGRDFELAVVQAVAELDEDLTVAALDEGVRAGLVRESTDRVGRYSFTHALIRETVYGKLSLLRRVRQHRRAGEALELLHADADHLAQLAHHFLQAAGTGDVDKALQYAEAAGVQALGRLAYEEAGGYYRRALEVIEAGGPEVAGRRAELLLGLGEAQRRAGDANASRESCFAAAQLAREHGDLELLGRASFEYGLGSGGLHRAVRCDEQHIALLEEVLAALGEAASPLRVRLLARLAEELYFTPQIARRNALADQAVTLAKELDDPAVLLQALYIRDLCRVGPDLPLEDRIQSTGELAELAHRLGDSEIRYLAHMLRELVFLELGDLESAQAELEGAARLADQLRMPSLQAWVLGGRSRRAWMDGRFADAEAMNGEAMMRALEQGGDPDVAGLVLGGQLLSHQLLRQDLTAFVPTLVTYQEDYPHLPIITCFLAYAYAETGKLDLAESLLADLGAEGFTDIPRTVEWPEAMWALSRCVCLLEDQARAAELYTVIAPCAGRWLADWASVLCGPVDTVLGMLAGLMGEPERAQAHFGAALAVAAAAPSPPWLVDARHQYGAFLLTQGRDGADLLRVALTDAERLGLDTTAERLRALLV